MARITPETAILHARTGEVDFPGGMIWLAENHSWIAHLRKTENADALVSIALDLIAAEEPSSQPSFPAKWAQRADSMTFAERAGLLLSDRKPPTLKAVG